MNPGICVFIILEPLFAIWAEAKGVGGIALLPREVGWFGEGCGTKENDGMEGVIGGRPCGVIATDPAGVCARGDRGWCRGECPCPCCNACKNGCAPGEIWRIGKLLTAGGGGSAIGPGCAW